MLEMWLKNFWNTFLGALYTPEKRAFWSCLTVNSDVFKRKWHIDYESDVTDVVEKLLKHVLGICTFLKIALFGVFEATFQMKYLCQIDCERKNNMFRSCEKRPKVSFRDSVLMVKEVLSRETAIFWTSMSRKHFGALNLAISFWYLARAKILKHMVHQWKFSLGKKSIPFGLCIA